ncbi:small ribosomal subunit protein bS18m [Bacillus rossius redtenbacheri]|uniref:small ribosomal subunit protein bS18m n=1 Tax=Bacillus rossius redtenbacheri TaxID=93214 RepID=UPI002FDD5B9B
MFLCRTRIRAGKLQQATSHLLQLRCSSSIKDDNSSQGFGNYEELDDKLIEARKKDMPVSDMENPFTKEKVQCVLCRLRITPDYKNAKLLSQFVSPYTGRVYGRHVTGLCLQQQKTVEEEIVKSQNAGYMAYYLKQVEFLHDPHLFDPEKPIRPHRF